MNDCTLQQVLTHGMGIHTSMRRDRRERDGNGS